MAEHKSLICKCGHTINHADVVRYIASLNIPTENKNIVDNLDKYIGEIAENKHISPISDDVKIVKPKVLYDDYLKWCESNFYEPFNKKRLMSKLSGMSIDVAIYKVNGKSTRGIKTSKSLLLTILRVI